MKTVGIAEKHVLFLCNLRNTFGLPVFIIFKIDDIMDLHK